MFDLKQVTLRIWNVYGWNVGADGYKDIAKRMGLPRSAVRYGRQAIQMNIWPAVVAGWVSDQRVVGMLSGLPLKLAQLIVRIETKLQRKLTRSRLAKLIQGFEAAWANRRAVKALEIARGLVDEAMTTHIYNDDEEPDEDCRYMAFIKQADEILGELK